MKLIIAGSRDFDDYDMLCEEADKYLFDEGVLPEEVEAEICGMARGADLLGKRWAEEREIKVLEFPANWKYYGRGAGLIRNEQMAVEGTHLLAFLVDGSRGTTNMIEQAIIYKLNRRVVEI